MHSVEIWDILIWTWQLSAVYHSACEALAALMTTKVKDKVNQCYYIGYIALIKPGTSRTTLYFHFFICFSFWSEDDSMLPRVLFAACLVATRHVDGKQTHQRGGMWKMSLHFVYSVCLCWRHLFWFDLTVRKATNFIFNLIYHFPSLAGCTLREEEDVFHQVWSPSKTFRSV